MTPPPQQITQLLKDWGNRDHSARDESMRLVYEELRHMAHQYMRRESPAHTLQTRHWSMKLFSDWLIRVRSSG